MSAATFDARRFNVLLGPFTPRKAGRFHCLTFCREITWDLRDAKAVSPIAPIGNSDGKVRVPMTTRARYPRVNREITNVEDSHA